MNITLSAYQTLDFNNPILSLELVVWSICIGLILGAIITFIDRRIIGDFVRRLIADKIQTPESAVTLAQIGFQRNFFVRSALRDGKALRRIVTLANEEDMPLKKAKTEAKKIADADITPAKKVDFENARFFIAEESRIKAELRYDKQGVNLGSLIVSIVLIIVCAVIALHVVPGLLEMLDGFLTSVNA